MATRSAIELWIKERQQFGTVYFKDNIRKIDAILVFKMDEFCTELKEFLWSMKKTHLHLEFAPAVEDNNLIFCKVCAPDSVLLKYAKIYNILLRKDQKGTFTQPEVPCKLLRTILNSPNPDPNDPICKRAWKTISKAKITEITNCERSVIVFAVMDDLSFNEEIFGVGLNQLLLKRVFISAFPLHDGPWEWPLDEDEPLNDRQLLAKYWANFTMLFKQQPLNTVEKYFGYECAAYFAWLGFYNKMLIFASLMGIISFLSGFYSVKLLDSQYIDHGCYTDDLKYCRKIRDPQPFSTECTVTYIAYLNSNFATWVYSYFMIIWSVVFKELWKRKLNILNAKWDGVTAEDYLLRPEYVANAKQYRRHKYTGQPELYMCLFETTLRLLCSIVGTILMVLLVVATLAFIIMVELALKKRDFNKIVIALVKVVLTTVFMTALEKLCFGIAASKLTKLEMPRTELGYEKSIHLKSLLFTFINSYGRIVYIGFFKTSCLMPGCFYEATVVMYTIVVVKPFWDNFLEVQKPMFSIIARKIFRGTKNLEKAPRWEREYLSNEYKSFLSELEEMLVQYGLITSFAACSPLAPCFALLHNLIEIKVDAIKILKYHRRTVARKQTTCIGDWFEIFDNMTNIIIIINSFFIAFTAYDGQVAYWIHTILHSQRENIPSFFDFKYLPTAENCYDTRDQHKDRYHSLSNAYKACSALFLIIIGFIVNAIISFFIPDMPKNLQYYLQYYLKRKRTNT